MVAADVQIVLAFESQRTVTRFGTKNSQLKNDLFIHELAWICGPGRLGYRNYDHQ